MRTSTRFLLLVLLSLPWNGSVGQAEPNPSPSEQVTISDVKVRISDHGPVVLLQAEGKTIPIFVDLTVAVSIQGALNGEKLSRPLSHDLMHSILETFGARVTKSVIRFKGGNYYVGLSMDYRDIVNVLCMSSY